MFFESIKLVSLLLISVDAISPAKNTVTSTVKRKPRPAASNSIPQNRNNAHGSSQVTLNSPYAMNPMYTIGWSSSLLDGNPSYGSTISPVPPAPRSRSPFMEEVYPSNLYQQDSLPAEASNLQDIPLPKNKTKRASLASSKRLSFGQYLQERFQAIRHNIAGWWRTAKELGRFIGWSIWMSLFALWVLVYILGSYIGGGIWAVLRPFWRLIRPFLIIPVRPIPKLWERFKTGPIGKYFRLRVLPFFSALWRRIIRLLTCSYRTSASTEGLCQ